MIAIIMGSDSDLPTMSGAAEILEEFQIPHRVDIVSAHRTPERMFSFATTAAEAGYRVIIAGAGGAAHLPGMVASMTSLPVIGVPIRTAFQDGMDSFLSITQMPRGIPVATVAVNNAVNAGLLAVRILAVSDPAVRKRHDEYLARQRDDVLAKSDRLSSEGWRDYLGGRENA
jgi:phosphoribosylaminoimidazole carboxylase